MYVRTTYRETCEFLATKGLPQGSTLSPYLFALIMEVPQCMLFTDDIIFERWCECEI